MVARGPGTGTTPARGCCPPQGRLQSRPWRDQDFSGPLGWSFVSPLVRGAHASTHRTPEPPRRRRVRPFTRDPGLVFALQSWALPFPINVLWEKKGAETMGVRWGFCRNGRCSDKDVAERMGDERRRGRAGGARAEANAEHRGGRAATADAEGQGGR